MKLWISVTGLLASALLLLGAVGIKARPVLYDPDKTGIVASAWVTGVGLPDAGDSGHGLYMAKNGPTATNAAAFAIIDGVDGITLTQLGYDVKDGGHCSGGAPRFNVTASDGFHFVGACTNGTVTGTPATGWTRYRFDLTNPAQAFPPIASGATIKSIEIAFDEQGSVVIDNVAVNDTLIGKPGLAK